MRLKGKRVVVTQVADYMGPAISDLFEREGAVVLRAGDDLTAPGACEALIERAGHLDVLVANLAPAAARSTPAEQVSDELFRGMFDRMVFPLHRLTRAVLPQMYARRAGKIVVVGSIAGLRAEKEPGRHASAYATARSAQVGYVRTVGVEAARHNVQINLIAQHFTYSETFFSKAFQQTEEFARWLSKVPAGRLATGEEDAELALFLASDHSNFISGTSIPFTGGWHL